MDKENVKLVGLLLVVTLIGKLKKYECLFFLWITFFYLNLLIYIS